MPLSEKNVNFRQSPILFQKIDIILEVKCGTSPTTVIFVKKCNCYAKILLKSDARFTLNGVANQHFLVSRLS